MNRPLRSKDEPQYKGNQLIYRDQINKVANAIKEIIQGLRAEPVLLPDGEIHQTQAIRDNSKEDFKKTRPGIVKRPAVKILWVALILAILIVIVTVPKIFKKNNAGKLTSEEILDKAISVCDYYSSWNNYTGKIRLIHVRTDGKIWSDQIIEIQTKEDFYKCTSIFSGKIKVVTGIQNGECFMEADSSDRMVMDKIKELGLDDNMIRVGKDHHYCIFGLLMELKASGLDLDDEVKNIKLLNEDCIALTFLCKDSAKVKSNWYKRSDWIVYLNPADYSLIGYKQIGYWNTYSIYSSNFLGTDNIKIPLYRVFYNNIDDSFSFIDLISIPE